MKKELALAFTSLSLLGCGGGGSPSSAPPPTSPDTFLTTLSPNIGETNVEPDTTIKATFSEDLFADSIDNESLSLRLGSEAVTTTDIEQTLRSIETTPDERLSLLTTYTATISSSISSLSGEELGSNLPWKFTTRDGIWRETQSIDLNADSSTASLLPLKLYDNKDAYSLWVIHDTNNQGSIFFKSLIDQNWQATVQITTETAEIEVVQVAYNSRGDVLVVWTVESSSIFSRYYNSQTNQWSSIEQLPSSNNAVENELVVNLGEDGVGYTAWSQLTAPDNLDLYLSRYEPNTGWQPVEVAETNTQESDHDPKLAIDSNNNMLLIWTNSDGSAQNDIYARRFISDGNGGGSWQAITQFGVFKSSVTDYSLVMNSSGNAVVTWTQDTQTLGENNLFARYYTPSSATPWGTSVLIEDKDGQINRITPHINDGGDVLVTWQHALVSGNDNVTNVYSNYFDSEEESWQDEPTFVAQISKTLESDQDNSRLSVHESGDAILTWTTEDEVQGQPNTTVTVLRSRIFKSSNTTWQPTLVIDTEGAIQGSAETMIDAQKHGLTVWFEQNDDNEKHLYMSRYNVSTNEWTVPFQLTEDPASITETSIGLNTKGEALLLWDQRDNGENEIFSKRFN